jgi:hypothetical protein
MKKFPAGVSNGEFVCDAIKKKPCQSFCPSAPLRMTSYIIEDKWIKKLNTTVS